MNTLQVRESLAIPKNSDFSIYNIPFGIGKINDQAPRALSRLGNAVIDLHHLFSTGLLDIQGLKGETLLRDSLNDFIALGKSPTSQVRKRIQYLASIHSSDEEFRAFAQALHPVDAVTMMMPVVVPNYTDFYSSKEHAFNVGSMFRGPDKALMPNWLHMPVAYHGRASSIVISGTPIRRPRGQILPPDTDQPVFAPSRLLDFELEMAFVVGKSNALGTSISTDEAEDYIFGLVLFNDWSARDIQKWEYQPLGPFLGKNFASTISPWIVTLEALEPFRVQGPPPEKPLLPYLQEEGPHHFDIELFVDLQLPDGSTTTVCRSNMKYLYWSMAQQLAHHTVNGCNMQVGDMCASGTISGPTPDSYGSMLELAWRGTRPLPMPDGSTRSFLHDGDTVILRGFAERNGMRVGFGHASGTIHPAIET